MIKTIQTKGFYTLAAATVLLLMGAFLNKGQTGWMVPGLVLIVGIQSMAAFWALLWAVPKSNSAFFSIFVGDALLRLTGLGVVTFLLWSRHIPYTGPLLTLALSYMVLSFAQIPFFYRVR